MKQLILNFHGVGVPPNQVAHQELKYWWDVTAFHNVLDAVVAARGVLPATIGITFDDGNMSDATIALPALLKRNLKASFFVCAGRIGAPNYLDVPAIRDLQMAGMSIGSHGMNHTDWRKLGEQQLNTEIVDARYRLEEVCGRSISEVAVPFGSYDRRVVRRLKYAKYTAAFTSDGGLADGHSWIRPRNTLDKSSYSIDLANEFKYRDRFVSLFRQRITMTYKRFR